MKTPAKTKPAPLIPYFLALTGLVALAWWIAGGIEITVHRQYTGLVDFSLGFVLLAAYACAQMFKTLGLPLLTGYLFAGIVSGPHVAGLLTKDLVENLKLVDELALSFIALSAGGMLRWDFLKERMKAILLNLSFQTFFIFALTCGFFMLTASLFGSFSELSSSQTAALAMLLGVAAVARSPSSAIAVISETRAKGVFTETVLGVTVAMDVVIIVLFTVVLSAAKTMLLPQSPGMWVSMVAVLPEILGALVIGLLLGKAIALYIDRIGKDIPLFLLLFAFSVTRVSIWFEHWVHDLLHVSMTLEPLLICMSAGFTVQNFSRTGPDFLESLDRFSLPVYVLFFALAGAALDLGALLKTWPLAVGLAAVRTVGLLGGSWLAGTLSQDPPLHNRFAWMAYLTQAGVAIGLARLTERQFPEMGLYLTTIVLAAITINQMAGPITFKAVLNMVKETNKR